MRWLTAVLSVFLVLAVGHATVATTPRHFVSGNHLQSTVTLKRSSTSA
ncbi:MAG: hypothetical protein QF738_08000 [Rhodospirillales bacterium]|jgi:hypothetical protein|nr:hypothetical protein [Rhodospirillales bacterium]